MNVLIGIPCLLTGGTEIQTLSLVKALIYAGHQVNVACYFEWQSQMVARFEQTGATVYLMSKNGKRTMSLLKTIRHLLKGFRKIIKESKPDVAHVQYMTPAPLAIMALRALGIKKIIATTHTGADIYSLNGLRIIKFLTNHVLSGFQCITLRAEESYFGSSRLFDGTLTPHFTVHNCLPEHIEIRQEPRDAVRDNQPLTVGVVSRLEHIKGMDLVVPAFALVLKMNPTLRILVAGDGSLRNVMELQAKKLGIDCNVNFIGPVPQKELQAVYDQIDILLMPSRSEGFGLTAIEGMARGCVPVVANTGGLPEVIRDGIDGLLHIQGRVDNIADAIMRLVSTPGLLNEMRLAVTSRAANFSQNNYNKIIKEVYDHL